MTKARLRHVNTMDEVIKSHCRSSDTVRHNGAQGCTRTHTLLNVGITLGTVPIQYRLEERITEGTNKSNQYFISSNIGLVQLVSLTQQQAQNKHSTNVS